MSERQYNAARYDIEWTADGQARRTLVIPYKSWVSLAEARQRLSQGSKGYCNLLVYRDISDAKLSREPTTPRVYLYETDRALFEEFDRDDTWDRFDAYSIGEAEPLEGWATGLFKAMGPERAKSVHRALSKVLHPDNPTTGDAAMWRELNKAYEGRASSQPVGLSDLFNFGGTS